jgi:hypothetical protein
MVSFVSEKNHKVHCGLEIIVGKELFFVSSWFSLKNKKIVFCYFNEFFSSLFLLLVALDFVAIIRGFLVSYKKNIFHGGSLISVCIKHINSSIVEVSFVISLFNSSLKNIGFDKGNINA